MRIFINEDTSSLNKYERGKGDFLKIEFQNVVKIIDSEEILNINNLVIDEGEIAGIIGKNGAGKTTMLRLMLDLTEASGGFITYNSGHIVSRSEEWKTYVGAYLNEDFIIGFLYPEEYFEFIGSLHGYNKKYTRSRIEQYKSFLGDELMDGRKLIRDLSDGNKRKVGILSSVIHDPDILLLDEPFNSLDPNSTIRLMHMLREMNRSRDMTIVISSNVLDLVTELCTRLILLENGNVLYDRKVSKEYTCELKKYFNGN